MSPQGVAFAPHELPVAAFFFPCFWLEFFSAGHLSLLSGSGCLPSCEFPLGLSKGGTSHELCLFFQIEAIEFSLDPESNKRQGSVFITYTEEEPVRNILEKFHTITGSKVRSL